MLSALSVHMYVPQSDTSMHFIVGITLHYVDIGEFERKTAAGASATSASASSATRRDVEVLTKFGRDK